MNIRSGLALLTFVATAHAAELKPRTARASLGAAFIAHATLEDVLSTVSDYDRYKEFYRPTVIDSRTLARGDQDDRFAMVLMNKSLFLKTVLDSECKCSSVRARVIDACTPSPESTRIQEIESMARLVSGNSARTRGTVTFGDS
jgi:hypothetical protein